MVPTLTLTPQRVLLEKSSLSPPSSQRKPEGGRECVLHPSPGARGPQGLHLGQDWALGSNAPREGAAARAPS